MRKVNYVNDKIQGINTKQVDGNKRIQDYFMEYQIIGQIVFFCLSESKILSSKAENFQNIVCNLEPNQILSKEYLKENKSLDKNNSIDNSNPAFKKQVCKQHKDKSRNSLKTSLNFSEGSIIKAEFKEENNKLNNKPSK